MLEGLGPSVLHARIRQKQTEGPAASSASDHLILFFGGFFFFFCIFNASDCFPELDGLPTVSLPLRYQQKNKNRVKAASCRGLKEPFWFFLLSGFVKYYADSEISRTGAVCDEGLTDNTLFGSFEDEMSDNKLEAEMCWKK